MLKRDGFDPVVLCPDGPFVKKIRQAGIRCRILPFTRRGLNPFKEFISLVYLWHIYWQERPDLVHHLAMKCIVFGSIIGWATNTRHTINEVCGLGFIFQSPSLLAAILKPIVKLLLRIFCKNDKSRFLFQNHGDAALFKSFHLTQDGFYHIVPGSGVDMERFRPHPDKQHHRYPVVLFAGRLLLDKGLLEFMAAAQSLKNEFPEAKFLIAGERDRGNPHSASQRQLDEWKRIPWIKFLGHVDNMPQLLRKTSIVVLPTSYGEGLPRILVEGAASALPIVTSDIPACHKIVKDSVNGFLCPPHHTEEITNAIRTLLIDPALCIKFGAASRRIAQNGFSQKIVFSITLDLYLELLRSNPAAH